MLEPLTVLLLLAALAVAGFYAAPWLIGYWFARRSWKLSSADVDGRFQGLVNYGQDGAYLAFAPSGEDTRVSFTKCGTGSGQPSLRLTISGERLSPSRAEAIAAKLDSQPDQLRWSLLRPASTGVYELELSGSILADPAAMEGVAAGVLAVLGFDSFQKYRIDFEGPSDQAKFAEFLRQLNRRL